MEQVPVYPLGNELPSIPERCTRYSVQMSCPPTLQSTAAIMSGRSSRAYRGLPPGEPLVFAVIADSRTQVVWRAQGTRKSGSSENVILQSGQYQR
nr:MULTISPECIES: hypothetical protein [unclassified Paenibacillus]